MGPGAWTLSITRKKNDVLRVTVNPEWVDNDQEWLSIAIVPEGLEVKWEKIGFTHLH